LTIVSYREGRALPLFLTAAVRSQLGDVPPPDLRSRNTSIRTVTGKLIDKYPELTEGLLFPVLVDAFVVAIDSIDPEHTCPNTFPKWRNVWQRYMTDRGAEPSKLQTEGLWKLVWYLSKYTGYTYWPQWDLNGKVLSPIEQFVSATKCLKHLGEGLQFTLRASKFVIIGGFITLTCLCAYRERASLWTHVLIHIYPRFTNLVDLTRLPVYVTEFLPNVSTTLTSLKEDSWLREPLASISRITRSYVTSRHLSEEQLVGALNDLRLVNLVM
jgi:hypothetical protein